ncbi:hypothetical protein ACFL3Q_04785 [Planctomycetota bacterium]
MSMLRPMRDELSKYRRRKRRSMDGSIPGAPYVGYRKSRRYVSGLSYVPRGPGQHHDLYNWGVPREYHPNLNAPSVDWTEYDLYEPVGIGHVPTHNNPRPLRGFKDSNQEIPKLPPSSDDLPLTEQFLMAMGKRNQIEQGVLDEPTFNIHENTLEAPELDLFPFPAVLRSIDELPDLEDLKEAFGCLFGVLPDDHPDLVNVRTAMRRVRDHKIALSEMNETDAVDFYPTGTEIDNNPFQTDPFQEAEQFFNKQMEFLEKSFDDQAIEPEGIQAAGLFEGGILESEVMPDETMPEESFMEEQTLEQIVNEQEPFDTPAPGFMEQDMMPDEMLSDMGMPGIVPEPFGYGAATIADEINQAIDELSQQPMPEEMEPDPFQPQFDPYMMGQNMLDQMQYMANPFAIPDPYGPMGLGPMGPMPGPMPGP